MASHDGKPPLARLLSAGARAGDRVARVTGVDEALDEAVEEAIVRALRSPAIGRAIERAIEERVVSTGPTSAEAASIVRQALESEMADRVWAEVLASSQAQQLVERVATAPELRSAIAAQTTGLITDIGVRLTRITEALDDAVERLVRHRDPDSETNQAGLITRLAAAAIDFALLFIAYSIISSMLASVIPFVFGSGFSLAGGLVLGLLGFLVAGGILSAFWALVGQTPGMRFLSIRLIEHGSNEVSARCAVRRVLALVLSLLPLGLGFLAIARDPQRRAWHDRLLGTEVVYETVKVAPHSVRRRDDGPATERSGDVPANERAR